MHDLLAPLTTVGRAIQVIGQLVYALSRGNRRTDHLDGVGSQFRMGELPHPLRRAQVLQLLRTQVLQARA